MRTLKKLSYKDYTEIKEDFKVEKIYFLPVVWEWISDEELENIDKSNLLFVWKRNWDWYLSEPVNDPRCEELRNVYFFNDASRDMYFEYMDIDPVSKRFVYVKHWEDNWVLTSEDLELLLTQ